ncbi:MAG: transcriptional regulator [Paracoccaceae bacterium]|nr:MAG: transcriptional regulator [Paracoccaceae bacterium]
MPRPPGSVAGADTPRGAPRADDLIVEAAWLYYHEELNQAEIAARLKLSRASVVNYLAEARQRGWVRLYLDSEVFLGHALSAELRAAYGLAGALVVPDDPEAGFPDRRVTRAAADWLPRLLAPGDWLGVSWGETVLRLAGQVPRHPIPDLTVVQLLGARPAARGFAAEICTTRIAERLGAHCINLHVPLLLSDRHLAERLRAEPVVAEQLAAVARCNKTVLACGTCEDDAHIVRAGLIDPARLATLRRQGAVGVICGRLIDAQGQPVPTEVEERMIGVTLPQMRGKEMALLVAAGAGRAEATRAAILGGFATHLATSATIARQLLARAP